MEHKKHHTIDYVEFPAKDISRIKEFYTKAFGWSFTDYGPDYTAFTGGNLDGGFTHDTPMGIGGSLIILYSESLEETKDTVARAGGVIVKDIYEFPGGRRFHFTDPSGNELAVWSDK